MNLCCSLCDSQSLKYTQSSCEVFYHGNELKELKFNFEMLRFLTKPCWLCVELKT